MVMVNTPGHMARNRDAYLVSSGAYQYGQPNDAGRIRVAKSGNASAMRALGGGGGVPGVGVGAGGKGVGGLAGAYQSALDSANAANQARYDEGHKGYTDLRQRTLDDLAKQGNQGRLDIDEQFDRAGAQISNDLVSRGLSASTAGVAPRMAAERERSGARARLDEALRRERIGYDVDLTKELLGFVERRDDEAPDLGQMLQLQQMAGQNMGGGGIDAASLAAPFMGGGFGQVSFPMSGAQMGMMGGGYGGGYGAQQQQKRPNYTKLMASLVNAGKASYNSGYSKAGNSGSGYFGSMNNVPQAYGGAGNRNLQNPGLRDYYGV